MTIIITPSKEILESQYNNTLQLYHLMIEMRDTLKGICKDSHHTVAPEILTYFKSKLDKIRQQSTNGFLVEEIIVWSSCLINITDFTEATEFCKKCINDLYEILSYFVAFKNADATQ